MAMENRDRIHPEDVRAAGKLARLSTSRRTAYGLRIAFVTESFLPATDGVVTRLRTHWTGLSSWGEFLIVAPKYGEGPLVLRGLYAGSPRCRSRRTPDQIWPSEPSVGPCAISP